MPRAVICSPSHIRNIVPPVSVIIVVMTKNRPGLMTMSVRALEADGDAVGLQRGEDHRAVARVLVDDLAALLALFLQGFERRDDRRHQLHDDRRRDVGHDAEGKDRHAADGAAGEHVEHADDAASTGVERLLERRRVDARNRDVGAEAIDQERAEREPDALLQRLGLGEGTEIEVGCELFCRRCHGSLRSGRAIRPTLRAFAPTNLIDPPAFSMAAAAGLEAPATSRSTFAFSSPLPRMRTPSRDERTRPAFFSAARSIVALPSSLPASIACLDPAEADLAVTSWRKCC